MEISWELCLLRALRLAEEAELDRKISKGKSAGVGL